MRLIYQFRFRLRIYEFRPIITFFTIFTHNKKFRKMFRKLLLTAAAAIVLAACGNSTQNNSNDKTMITPNPENALKAQQFLKDAQTYYLATVDGDQPHVRPFGTAEIFEGRLYIQTGKVKNVYKQLIDNPKAEICAYKDGRWIRICCELIPDERIEAKKDMLDKNSSLRSMYNEADDNTIVFYARNATATISSFTSDPETFTF